MGILTGGFFCFPGSSSGRTLSLFFFGLTFFFPDELFVNIPSLSLSYGELCYHNSLEINSVSIKLNLFTAHRASKYDRSVLCVHRDLPLTVPAGGRQQRLLDLSGLGLCAHGRVR